MTVKTTSLMKMEHFHDFYFLEALRAKVDTLVAGNPDLEFSKPVEKFIDDLDRLTDKIVPNMALRVFTYLWAASLGEARHAKESVASRRYLIAPLSDSRKAWFESATKFAPSKKNVQILFDIFDQPWRSGYGGKAWADIVRAVKEYDTIAPSAWIDHVVDLEHNNGTVFSKPEAKNAIFFDVLYDGRFSEFLDYKFRADILTQKAGFAKGGKLKVSPRIYSMLERYATVFKQPMPNAVSELDNLTDYAVEWGDGVLRVGEKLIEYMTISRSGKTSMADVLNMFGLNDISPSYYTTNQLKKKLEDIKKRVYDKVKNPSPSFKAQMTKALNAFYAANQKSCKLPKAPTLYKALPVTFKQVGNQAMITVHLPYQDGYGTPLADGGFMVEIPWFGKGDFENAVIMRLYGDLMMKYGTRYEYWVSSAVLEAILD